MLPSLRITAARCLPRHVRPLATAGSINDKSIFDEALFSLGSASLPTVTPPSPASSFSASPSIPSIIEIPPAEDPLLRYFTSWLLNHGHRAKASRIMSNTLLHIHAFTRAPALPILRKAVLDAAPSVRTLMHRQGGKTIPRPVALSEKQRTRYAVKEILKAAKKGFGRTVEERLARELIKVVQGTSKALESKQTIHNFAMVNRGNAQTRV